MTIPSCPACYASRSRPHRTTALGFRTVVCIRCGLEHVVPRPTPERLEEIYTESYYESWNLKDEFDAVRRLKGRTSEGHLKVLERFCRTGRILDVGCATGFFLHEAKRRGWDPFGVELSEFAADEAKRLIGQDRIYQGTVENCPFSENSFEAISMMDCIEHVTDVGDVMDAVTRLLRPGGCLLVTTPFAGSFTYKVMGGRWTHYKEEHLQYFGRDSARRLMKRHGLRIVHLSGARKHISTDYFAHQFERYRHPVLTPISKIMRAIVPGKLRHATVPLVMGDMLLIGRKAHGSRNRAES